MDRLSLSRKLGYGLGHILNDLCASMWFTYLLLFFHKVLDFNNNYSGVILLVGQLADGISTTIVGALCDRQTSGVCSRYGQRKSWHLVGTVCVLLSFPFIFLPCLGCERAHEWAQMIYYSAFAIVFQFGWASVQISHLALIPGLTSCQDERTRLTAIRYGMTVVSNILVYLIAWLILGQSSEMQLSSDDEDKFRNLALSAIAIGSVTSLAFHFLVKENDEVPSPYAEINGGSTIPDLVHPMGIKDWFKEPQFYQVAGVYMSTRLFVNLSQAYLPLYLQESLQLESKYVAIIPLVMYCSGFVTSYITEILNRKIGRKISYVIGSLVGIAASVCVYYGGDRLGHANDKFFKSYGIFFAAALYGSAGSTLLITSLSLTAELISSNTESAAFVYGAMSFTDKVSNGLAVMVIQHFIPCLKCDPSNKWYFSDVLFYATGGAALLGIMFLLSLFPSKVGHRRRDRVVETEREPLLGDGTQGSLAYT